jgi:hypothetical protein
MVSIDWLTFFTKLILVPIFIGAVSLAGRRWGPTLSGWLIGLPLTSGPVAFFLALEQGNAFASEASQAIMVGIMSVFMFCLAYSWSAIRSAWLPSMMAGVGAFLVTTYLLQMLSPALLIGFVSTILVLTISLLLMPRVSSDKLPPVSPSWDLPVRMISATALVLLITGLAQSLGPELTGLLSPFPVYATTLAVFTHRTQDGKQAVRLLRGVIVGSFTFIMFFLVVSLTIVEWGVGLSFLTAIVVSLLTHTASLQFLRSRSRISD